MLLIDSYPCGSPPIGPFILCGSASVAARSRTVLTPAPLMWSLYWEKVTVRWSGPGMDDVGVRGVGAE